MGATHPRSVQCEASASSSRTVQASGPSRRRQSRPAAVTDSSGAAETIAVGSARADTWPGTFRGGLEAFRHSLPVGPDVPLWGLGSGFLVRWAGVDRVVALTSGGREHDLLHLASVGAGATAGLQSGTGGGVVEPFFCRCRVTPRFVHRLGDCCQEAGWRLCLAAVSLSCFAGRAGIRDLELGVANGEPGTLAAVVRLVGAAESPLDLPDDQTAGTGSCRTAASARTACQAALMVSVSSSSRLVHRPPRAVCQRRPAAIRSPRMTMRTA